MLEPTPLRVVSQPGCHSARWDDPTWRTCESGLANTVGKPDEGKPHVRLMRGGGGGLGRTSRLLCKGAKTASRRVFTPNFRGDPTLITRRSTLITRASTLITKRRIRPSGGRRALDGHWRSSRASVRWWRRMALGPRASCSAGSPRCRMRFASRRGETARTTSRRGRKPSCGSGEIDDCSTRTVARIRMMRYASAYGYCLQEPIGPQV